VVLPSLPLPPVGLASQVVGPHIVADGADGEDRLVVTPAGGPVVGDGVGGLMASHVTGP